MADAEREKMGNLVAKIFRIEISDTLKSSIKPFLSIVKWPQKTGELFFKARLPRRYSR